MQIIKDIFNLPQGAVWLKADLHVHTPASRDISEKWANSKAEDVVRIALEKELDIIAITDHNTVAWCDDIRTAAKSTSLTVFPGVEISTHQGHVLGIFDVNTPQNIIEDLLIKLGIDRDKFGSLEVATDRGIVEVCTVIEGNDGVAIAAHVDSERGFMKLIRVGDERRRAYAASNLRALEIVDLSQRERYQLGKTKGYERRLACIQASDCWSKEANRHELDGMAYRYSLIKMHERSLSGLKLALIDPEMRIRLPGDDNPAPEHIIVAMWVTGGFLNGQKFKFNENVNCYIGDTGTGKSLALELLRFGLDQCTTVEKVEKEVHSMLSEELKDMGTVHIVIRKGDTYYLVERTWTNPQVEPVISRISKEEVEKLDDAIAMKLFFPIKAFSQSEIIEFARDPEVRLSLTDDLIDISSEKTEIYSLKVSLRENATSILAEQSRKFSIEEGLGELPGLVETKKQLDKALDDKKIQNHQLWYKERKIVEDAESQFNNLTDKLAPMISALKLEMAQEEEIKQLPNQDIIGELKNIYEEWEKELDKLKKGVSERLTSIIEKLGGLIGRWKTRFEKEEGEYKKLLAEIDKDNLGLQTLSDRRNILIEQISVLEKRKSELENDVIPKIYKLQEDRDKILTEMQQKRRGITIKRESKAKELSQKLENKIRLNIHSRENTNDFKNDIRKIQTGGRLQVTDIEQIAKNCHPISFVKNLLNQDFDTLSEQSQVDKAKFLRVYEAILERNRLDELYEMQLTDVDDIIEVMLEVEKGEYKAIENLAHGQKCMVVLMVALAEGEFPLIVDQPEDALHAPGIEAGIVSTLRSRRGIRQCIFATRNANIIVSADAEQIFALKADAHQGELVSCGCLDNFDQKSLVIYHVEGGEEAFERRKTMYSLRPN